MQTIDQAYTDGALVLCTHCKTQVRLPKPPPMSDDAWVGLFRAMTRFGCICNECDRRKRMAWGEVRPQRDNER